MTVFTKKDATEEKNQDKPLDKEKENSELPKVVVSGSPNAPSEEERHISNCGWIPMEGGNFDRPKEKRSSSFGPLSIIRLSPSPLARTPSPTPPEYENHENELRYRRCTKITIFFGVLIGLGLGTGLYFYQRGLINSAYNRGVYHGWNAATYSNKGVPERLEQNVEINPEESYEKIDVPRFGSNRPAVFLHDFKANLTAIVDVMGKRCFLKPLDRRTTAAPKNLIEMLRGMNSASSLSPAPRVIRETFRVGEPMSEGDVTALNSFMISRHCSFRPVYMLEKAGESRETRRVRRASEPESLEKLDFVSMGGDSVEVDTITF